MKTDREIIKKFKIGKNDKILDVGGAMMQHTGIKVDTLIDIIRPEEAPYTSSKLLAKKFVRLDITKEMLPFADKSFDFCLCTHTLEDLYNPFSLMDEMSRVAKRGFITTPSMGMDMVFSKLDITNWLTGAVRVPGLAHHKWFFVKKGNSIRIIPKNYGILYSSRFHIIKWLGDAEMQFYWQGKISYKHILDLNIHTLIDEYESYLNENKDFYLKGKPLIYLDNPLAVLKAYTKLVLKRGNGYKYRKVMK